jgi:hypothetical protein
MRHGTWLILALLMGCGGAPTTESADAGGVDVATHEDAHVQEDAAAPDLRPIVFVLAGEKRAFGAAPSSELTPTTKIIPENVTYWRNGERPEAFSVYETWGPEVALAHGLAAMYPDRQVILIKRATACSSSLYASWRPTWDPARAAAVGEVEHIYKALVADLERAVGGRDVAWGALFWLQGEADASLDAAAADYAAGLEALSQTLWNHTGAEFPWVICLPQPGDDLPFLRDVRTAQQQSGFPWIDPDDLTEDATGQLELGNRLIDEFVYQKAMP